MKSRHRHLTGRAILVCLIGFLQVYAFTVKDTLQYPYPVFSNNKPVPGGELDIQWILGMHPDGCVPAYETNTTKTAKDSVISYYLNYREMPIDYVEDPVCDQALTPYGPVFTVGPLASGFDYKIYIDTTLIREFSLEKKEYPYPIVVPSDPHEGDIVEVYWVFGMDTVNCVPQFTSTVTLKSVLESDPPIRTFDVDYVDIDVDYVACIPRPTQFGPVFKLGEVQEGDYVLNFHSVNVARFSVGPRDVKKLEVTATPEQPAEGDTLTLQLILGRGSSSCAPKFIPEFDMNAEDGAYSYQLRYSTIENIDSVCTYDFRAYGPKWIFPDIESGYHEFLFEDNRYYKVYVNKKRAIPEFSKATIRGVVREDGIIYDTLGSDQPKTVPQCTVTVVFGTSVTPESGTLTVHHFSAVTNELGEYTIDGIPSSLLTGLVYLVATKNSTAGYRMLPDELTENMDLSITLGRLETFVESVRTIVPESGDVALLLRELGLEGNSSTVATGSRIAGSLGASVTAVPGGFSLINPSTQKVAIAAYMMNGRKIWGRDAARLSEGSHLFRIPHTAQGIVLIRVNGEHFRQSKVIILRHN